MQSDSLVVLKPEIENFDEIWFYGNHEAKKMKETTHPTVCISPISENFLRFNPSKS